MRPGIVFPPLLPEKGLAKLQQEEQSIRKHAGHPARTWLQLLWGCPAFFFWGGEKIQFLAELDSCSWERLC